ncbi:MAG TPA: cyclopropane fatty acyl phospholipid synthase [Candidatus Paceibacterota bacterium]
MHKEKEVVKKMFTSAGIEIGGKKAWDILVHDERFYRRVLAYGSLGLGESYMDKWWDCDRIDLCIEKILRSGKSEKIKRLPLIYFSIKSRLFNLQSKGGARTVMREHYNLSNALYMSFLDSRNQYTCGFFQGTNDLDKAQEQKLDLICRKLHLQSGDRVLDIGCGWGGFAKYAAEKYGCTVVGITLSDAQIAYARAYVTGLPVEIRKQDYRDLAGEQFSKIVSVGMMEHVGYKNYRIFMEIVRSCLSQNGLFLLHAIGQNTTSTRGNAWSDKYIFPHGMLPSLKQITAASEGVFVMEDWHNFGPYYHKTLLAWDKNFQQNWPQLQSHYSETFYRMFRYYFNSFAGAFKARHIQLWQIVFSKGEYDKVYHYVR